MPYSSDVSDEQWVLIEPVITAWKAAHPSVSGHQGRYAMREIVNGILYQNRRGCQWDQLPHALPPAGAVKYYFYKWRDDGTDQTIHDLLRWQLRERNRRLADPSLVVMDTQSIRAAVGVPADTTGKDASKRVPGRKRGLERTRACLKSKPTDLRAVVNIARRNQVASLESSDRSLLDPRYMSMRNSLMRFVTLALASPETEVVKDIWNAEVVGFRGRIWFTDISQHWLREATKRWAVSTTCPVAEASMPPGWSKDASIRSPSGRPRLRLRQVPATGGWLEGDAVGIEREAGVSRMFLLGN
ncbi:Putative transposase of IS4/5 family [Streptomyces sp. KS_5]|nr:Putative transposase of IS4/5 family [Streptomyces sp. KS_5]